jgi:TolB protein
MTTFQSVHRLLASRTAAAVAIAAAALVGTASLTPVAATSPGVNGQIVFMRADANGFWQVWRANPDLRASAKLTDGPADSGWAVWSPDGSRIAFDSDRTDPDLGDAKVINDVFTVRADGTDLVKLTDSIGFAGDPGWSPDGQLITFDKAELGVFVASAVDGSGRRKLTWPGAGELDSSPRFSPTGTQIVFTRFRGGHFLRNGRLVGDTSALFVVGVDGSGLHRVTGWGNRVGDADWSPDGKLLVFEQVGEYPGPTDIMTVRADGGSLAQVTSGVGIEGSGKGFKFEGFYDPVWSPDGAKILVGHGIIGPDGYTVGLATINPDGSGLAWASADPQVEHQPDWGTAPLQ